MSKEKNEVPMVEELDRNGNPTGNKIRSGGETHAEPQPPGGGPPGSAVKGPDYDRIVKENEEADKANQPQKKK
jgi:hypothetical protein